MASGAFPRDFAARRWHSFLGLILALYIIFHLLTNSQAALFFDQEGSGFVHDVNWIHSLPFLPVLEIAVIGFPFLFHGVLGIRYALSSKMNHNVIKYAANRAYSWQRITAWILLVLIIFHVVQMRFLDYPAIVPQGGGHFEYVVRVKDDAGLKTVAQKHGVKIYSSGEIEAVGGQLGAALRYRSLKEGQVMLVADSFGEAALFSVRNTFKSFWMMAIYTVLVLAAVYHGFRGLWSFSIVWGLALTQRSQKMMSLASIALMVIVGFLGLAAVYLTYWVTLKA
ncbi:MAG: succinate dehydrogenase [Verrucomicrobia bacterium]|nr:succinate dehydrogenase [Verrucomicrobiota bacterium]